MTKAVIAMSISLALMADQAGLGLAHGADLGELAGTWAENAAGCRDYLAHSLQTEAAKRRAGLMIIRPTSIEFIEPRSCRLGNIRGDGTRWVMSGACELKGQPFSSAITIVALDRSSITVRLSKTAVAPDKPVPHVRCSKDTEWSE
jgi:hypothetical protein